jgi:hypothetical protein
MIIAGDSERGKYVSPHFKDFLSPGDSMIQAASAI